MDSSKQNPIAKTSLVTPDKQIKAEDLRRIFRTDHRLFLFHMQQAELPEGATIPDFHVELFGQMVTQPHEREDGKDKVQAVVFRGANKTGITICSIIYDIGNGLYFYIVYVTADATHSLDILSDIVDKLESEEFTDVYGTPEFTVKRRSDGFYQFKLNGKMYTLRARSIDQHMRGKTVKRRRPDKMYFDDVEIQDNSDTEEKVQKLVRKMYSDFIPAMTNDMNKKMVVQIGNLITPYSMLLKNEQSANWHCTRYGAILADGTLLWPEVFPLERLQKDYEEYAKKGLSDVWFSENMNIVSPPNSLISTSEIDIREMPEPSSVNKAFITIDPAFSASTHADETAIVVHIEHPYNEAPSGHRQWMIAEVVHGVGIKPYEMWQQCKRLIEKYNIKLVGIESVAAQRVLIDLFHTYMERSAYSNRIHVVPLTAGAAKHERILAWVAMLKSKEYCLSFAQSAVMRELGGYDLKKKDNKDDVIDACSYGVQVLQKYANLIGTTQIIEHDLIAEYETDLHI